MKKISYNTKTLPELHTERASLKATIQSAVASTRVGKNSKIYLEARKNLARVMTALNALPMSEPVPKGINSTESEK